MIRLGEERIEKRNQERVTKVPLLIAIWIKLNRTTIDHHPINKNNQQTKHLNESSETYVS